MNERQKWPTDKKRYNDNFEKIFGGTGERAKEDADAERVDAEPTATGRNKDARRN